MCVCVCVVVDFFRAFGGKGGDVFYNFILVCVYFFVFFKILSFKNTHLVLLLLL